MHKEEVWELKEGKETGSLDHLILPQQNFMNHGILQIILFKKQKAVLQSSEQVCQVAIMLALIFK